MTIEEAQKLYEELEEFYGDKLVNFEQQPKIFEFQVQMYRFLINKNE